MDKFKHFFSESGDLSCMRLMSVVSLLIAGFIAIYEVITYGDISGVTPLVSVFVGAGFGAKIWQKAYERK